MISTIADFLEQFRNYALSKINRDEQNVKHRPTIGNIFEGLTAELLNKSVFQDFNLKIVERSFIYNNSGDVSDEIDCMLVVGDGFKISYTSQYKYHIKDVIAVFQVKKNLYANDIDDSHKNLHSVINVSEPRDAEPFVGSLHRDAYRLLAGKEMPSEERRKRFTDRENILYHFFMMEAFHPLRIVIGYYGYTTEYALREGFINKIDEISKNGPVSGYSPGSFPNLIICGNSTIIKNNGMPMGIPFTNDDFYWNILITSSGRPMYHLLELIWTRLSYKFEISSNIFGDDFDLESTHPFISCKEKKINKNSWGWELNYHYLTKEQLAMPMNHIPWAPTEIDKNKYTVLMLLTEAGLIDIETDERFLKFIDEGNLDAEKMIKELIEARLVYIDEGKIGLLVDDLLVSVSTDGKIYAGENKSGEMSSFIARKFAEKTPHSSSSDA